jgi:hypothetical protein
LFLWGYPVCRQCAARIRAQAPRDIQGRTIYEPGCAHRLERVTGSVDDLDVQLALHILDAMLDSLKDLDAANTEAPETRAREVFRRPLADGLEVSS